jgi:hypothetical protein
MILRRPNQVQCLQAGGERIDTGQYFSVATVDIGRRHTVRTNGTKAETRSQRIQGLTPPKGFVQRLGSLKAQFGMAEWISIATNVSATFRRGVGDHGGPLLSPTSHHGGLLRWDCFGGVGPLRMMLR